MIVYRLHRHTRQPFEYNLNRESRWNPARTSMLYCASTVSLCCLEVLVHTDPDLLPDNLVWSWAELPADPEVLDYQWSIADVERTRAAGKRRIESLRSLAIRVPSAIVPHTPVDFNILLNPLHDAWTSIHWQRGGPFRFDPRLFFDEPSPVP
ncbi:MAG: RES family NAD+ phosphorylase [Bryobacteraceae bacterium]